MPQCANANQQKGDAKHLQLIQDRYTFLQISEARRNNLANQQFCVLIWTQLKWQLSIWRGEKLVYYFDYAK